MPEFRIEKVKNYLQDIDIAIETGTFKGHGTRVMAKNFKNVSTIELDPVLHKETSAQLKLEGYSNVDFLFGDSGDAIVNLTKTIKIPAMFYLDAHWSGDTSVNWSESDWKGYKTNTAHLGKNDRPTSLEQVPLNREVEAIALYFEPKGVIYIDDLDKFSFSGKGLKDKAFIGEDYSHLDLKLFRHYLGNRLKTWKNLKNKQLIMEFHKIPETSTEEFQQKLYYNTIYKAKFLSDHIYLYLRWKLKGK